ncbi:MAG: cyclic pyranopterin monophosphate synthase MoaC [Alcanivoracaceae bacterium]|nr:cyclic pyranopterin monophosphate synthase MoaC [Alcanivoracaceae bacterium]
MPELTHIDKSNNPTMVDVSDKKITKRTATATSTVIFPDEIKHYFQDNELVTKKGPVYHTAIIAGVMAAKKTHELIPFCHPLAIENCKIDIKTNDQGNADITCKVSLHHKTGVEMEALTGASIAALTIYDMCKALSHDIVITATKLVKKTGGKSDK